MLAEAHAINYRTPFITDPIVREQINSGEIKYQDIHLSHLGMFVEQGFFGKFDVAIIEAVRITEDGHIVPSSAVGNNVEFMEAADKIIIEVNEWQSPDLEGMHDIWMTPKLPNRTPIPINNPGDRIGKTYIPVDKEKVVAVVKTDATDRNAPFKPADEVSKKIAGHFLDVLEGEVEVVG